MMSMSVRLFFCDWIMYILVITLNHKNIRLGFELFIYSNHVGSEQLKMEWVENVVVALDGSM